MGFSLRTENLKRYKDLARLFMKYGRSELVQRAGLEEALAPDESGDLGEVLLFQTRPAEFADGEPRRGLLVGQLARRDVVDGVVEPGRQPDQEEILVVGE